MGQKTAAVLALTNVNAEDRVTLTQLAEVAKTNFNDRASYFRRTWGGLSLGVKSQHRQNIRDKIARAEADAQKTLAAAQKTLADIQEHLVREFDFQ